MRVTMEIYTADMTEEQARQFIEAVSLSAEQAATDVGVATPDMSIHDSDTKEPIEHER